MSAWLHHVIPINTSNCAPKCWCSLRFLARDFAGVLEQQARQVVALRERLWHTVGQSGMMILTYLDISWQNGEIFYDFWWCVRAASSWPIPPIPKVIGWISICFWCPPGSSAHSKTYGALNIGRRWRDAKPRPGRVPLKIWRIGCNHKGSRMV